MIDQKMNLFIFSILYSYTRIIYEPFFLNSRFVVDDINYLKSVNYLNHNQY